MHSASVRTPAPSGPEVSPSSRLVWITPAVEVLAPLCDLTLQNGPEIPGDPGSGGGGVIP